MDEKARLRREERIAENEVLHREVNEAVDGLGRTFAPRDGGRLRLCECGDHECSARLRITQEEYGRVRSDPLAFVVVPGHELPEAEEVVWRGEEFLVVRKTKLPGQRIAGEAWANRERAEREQEQHEREAAGAAPGGGPAAAAGTADGEPGEA